VRIREGMRGHRPLPANEPQPRQTPPKCPSHLNAAQKKEWKRLATLLMRMRVLTESDGDALEQLVVAIVAKREAEQVIASVGLMVPGSTGNEVLNPACKERDAAASQIRWWSTQFGLTPSARTRVAAEPLNEEGTITDDVERALCG
jgi:P27 family predicted phage terminase small subunit